jgi:hypothetical protein
MTPRRLPRNAFVVRLEPLPDASDPDGLQRLRRALKLLRRAFGLRCTSATTTEPESTKESA